MVYVCFSASTASDKPSWSSGPQEIFEETSKVHFTFLFCWVFVVLLFVFMLIHVTMLCLISNWANARVTLSVLLSLLRHLSITASFEEGIRLRKAKA